MGNQFNSLPVVAAENIASFLDGSDVINLGLTCKYWYEVSQTNRVWKKLVERRFGKQHTEENEDQKHDEELVKFKHIYMKLAVSKKAATDFYCLHLNGRYFEKIHEPSSKFGDIIRLNSVCWMNICSNYEGVLPGEYRLIWRMKLDNVYVSSDHVEFRAIPEESCGTELCTIWKKVEFKEAERKFGTNTWFDADFGLFTVTSLCKVKVQIRRCFNYWCGGMSWDYAELRPVCGSDREAGSQQSSMDSQAQGGRQRRPPKIPGKRAKGWLRSFKEK